MLRNFIKRWQVLSKKKNMLKLNLHLKEGVNVKKKTISILLIVIGIILMIGSIGAAECDTISIHQFLIQSLMGLIIMLGGAYIGI